MKYEKVDDYIEPVIRIQQSIKKIDELFRQKDNKSAFMELANMELQIAILKNWSWKHFDAE